MRNLSGKQQAFINAYQSNGHNATRAAIEAGYSRKTAYSQGQRLLKNVEIKSAIEKVQTKAAEATAVSQQWCIEQQKLNYELAIEKGDFNAAIKAVAEISKLIGAYAPEKHLHGNIDFTYLQALEAAKRLTGGS